MRRLCLPLLAFAVLCQVNTGRSAEPPITCKLDLVRMEPLPPGKPCPENETWMRNVRGRDFFLHKVGDDVGIDNKTLAQAEVAFQEIIQREPEKYQAQYPFRAVVAFGDQTFGFVLDKQTPDSPGYDRLYFDVNGNGDLTDDVAIDVPVGNKTAEGVKSENGWASVDYELPRVDLKLHIEGNEWDYSLLFKVGTYTREQDVMCRASLVPGAYRQGEITLEGRKRTIALVDWLASGRFDIPISFASDGNGLETFIAKLGTEILLDQDIVAASHLGTSHMDEHRQFLAKMNALGGRCYEVKVRPSGNELTCTPVEAPMGKIATQHSLCSLWLVNEQGLLAFDCHKDTPMDIPVGVWRLMFCTFGQNETSVQTPEQKETKNSPPSEGVAQQTIKDATDTDSKSPGIRYVSASGGTDCEPITVIAGQTTMLEIGPPYTPTLTVVTRDNVAALGLKMKGVGQEAAFYLSGEQPPKPTFTITDPQGKVVEQGSFEYG